MARGTALILAGLLLAACAAYEPPRLEPVNWAARSGRGDQGEILGAASRALLLEGYEIVASDHEAGTLATAPRVLRLSAAETDCGGFEGRPSIAHRRTETRVSLGIVARDGWLRVRTRITGQYLGDNFFQRRALTCVSTGALEDEILRKIQAQL